MAQFPNTVPCFSVGFKLPLTTWIRPLGLHVQMTDFHRFYNYEGGRRYGGYEEGAYHLPNDEAEFHRLGRVSAYSRIERDIEDMYQHEVWLVCLHGKMYISPVEPGPGFRVLDVGTGIGVWATAFANHNPSAHVTGIDLLEIKFPISVPGNCQFQVGNAEKEWAFSVPFDFIHSRLLYFGMHDWPTYFRRCFENLKPGGWVEAKECVFPLGCDDDSAGPDSALMRWGDCMHEALTKSGIDTAPGDTCKDYLSTQGFTNVQNKIMKWPCRKMRLGRRWGECIDRTS